METDKQELRRELKKTRAAMPAGEAGAKSRIITEKLIGAVDWAKVKNVHVYSAVPEWNEVDTGLIIEFLKREWPQIRITRPDSSASQKQPKRRFNLIIVPCLGFDKDLYRLGLGAGFYDKFLAGQPQATKVGLAFASGFVKTGLPREQHDIPLDKIVTEEGIMKAHDSQDHQNS